MTRRIVLEDGQPPAFDGQWTVGEVLAMAEALARWVQSLAVSQPAPQQKEPKNEQNKI